MMSGGDEGIIAHRNRAAVVYVRQSTASPVEHNCVPRLTLLAPDIQEAVVDGRQPKGMQLQELLRGMPSCWEQQRALV